MSEETRVARQLREAAGQITINASTARTPSPMFIGEDPLTWVPLEHAGEEVPYGEPGAVIEVRQRKMMGRVRLTWECFYRRVTPAAYAHRLEAVLHQKADDDNTLDIPMHPEFPREWSFLRRERMDAALGRPPFWTVKEDDE